MRECARTQCDCIRQMKRLLGCSSSQIALDIKSKNPVTIDNELSQVTLLATTTVAPSIWKNKARKSYIFCVYENAAVVVLSNNNLFCFSHYTDFVLVAVILLSHRFHMNPDNLATPLAASIGDVVSLSVLSFIASKLFEYIGECVWVG